MQDRKPSLILASEEDALRYQRDDCRSGLPESLSGLSKNLLAREQRGNPIGYDHIHLSIGSTHRHLVQWWGRASNGYHYPIGNVMVILDAAGILYPNGFDAFSCPIHDANCLENCGSYGCGN